MFIWMWNGNHDEGTCTKNGGHRSSAHDAVSDLLIDSATSRKSAER
jgi:hypothetical protein